MENTESKSENKYVILMETSGEEWESWYTFIKQNGNEEAINHLKKQLDSVDWYILDDLSTFDIETDHPVSELTAKEMINVDLNSYSFHRKFDGVLKKIDLGFNPNQSNEKKMKKAFKILGYGGIEKFIDKEDVDPKDLVEDSENDSSEDGESTEEAESNEEDTESKESKESKEENKETSSKKKGKLPAVLQAPKKQHEIPRFAKAKAKKHKNKK